MSTSNKVYKYSVDLDIHTIDAPGAQLITRGNLYVNICLLGVRQRTRFHPPCIPMYINQCLHFNKTFKLCYSLQDIIQRLEREHVLIELLQKNGSSSTILATLETSAKEFLYPYSTVRIQYTGLRRYLILNRTIDFPGTNPSLEFTVSPSVEDISGFKKMLKSRKYTKPIVSYGKNSKRSKSLTWKPSFTYPHRCSVNDSAVVSTSVTSHTISSAIKNDYSKPATKAKLRELAMPGEVKYVVEIDKTSGREPFVVRHVNKNLIGRKPQSHYVFNDGLVVNDYSLSRANSSMSLYSSNDGDYYSRSSSRANRGRSGSRRKRARSASVSRRLLEPSYSTGFQVRGRSRTPERYSNLYSPTRCLHDDRNVHNVNEDCAICRLHRMHSEQSRRAKSLEQQRYMTMSKSKLYSPDDYTNGESPYQPNTTVFRDSLRYRHQPSPAGELSDKILQTLRHNLESYSAQPSHKYYSGFRYSDGHVDDDELLERSRRLTQA